MQTLNDFKYVVHSNFAEFTFSISEENNIIVYIGHIVCNNIKSLDLVRWPMNKSYQVRIVTNNIDLSELKFLSNDFSIEFVQNDENIRFNDCTCGNIHIYKDTILLNFNTGEQPIFSNNTIGEAKIDN